MATANAVVVTESGSTFDPACASFGCTVIRDPALNTATSVKNLHWIAVTKYASFFLPVWAVNLNTRRIYVYEWAGEDGILTADAGGDSVGLLDDERVFDKDAPWEDTPTASFAGDPHMTVRRCSPSGPVGGPPTPLNPHLHQSSTSSATSRIPIMPTFRPTHTAPVNSDRPAPLAPVTLHACRRPMAEGLISRAAMAGCTISSRHVMSA